MFYFVFVFVCVFVDLDKEQAELWLLCPPGATVQATPGQSLVNDPTFAARLQVANCQVIQNITCSISRKKVISIISASYHFACNYHHFGLGHHPFWIFTHLPILPPVLSWHRLVTVKPAQAGERLASTIVFENL